jgi:hypothetical protein
LACWQSVQPTVPSRLIWGLDLQTCLFKHVPRVRRVPRVPRIHRHRRIRLGLAEQPHPLSTVALRDLLPRRGSGDAQALPGLQLHARLGPMLTHQPQHLRTRWCVACAVGPERGMCVRGVCVCVWGGCGEEKAVTLLEAIPIHLCMCLLCLLQVLDPT